MSIKIQEVIDKREYQARYSFDVVTQNKRIFSRDKFSCITFENIGDTDASINGLIPCTNNGVIREFVELPNTTIDTDFTVQFDTVNPGTNPAVLVVKTYYTKHIGE